MNFNWISFRLKPHSHFKTLNWIIKNKPSILAWICRIQRQRIEKNRSMRTCKNASFPNFRFRTTTFTVKIFTPTKSSLIFRPTHFTHLQNPLKEWPEFSEIVHKLDDFDHNPVMRTASQNGSDPFTVDLCRWRSTPSPCSTSSQFSDGPSSCWHR